MGRQGASARDSALPGAWRGAQLGAGYASGGWAPGDEAEAELAGYAAKGFTAAKMRVVGRDGFSVSNCVRRVKAARRGLGPNVELMIDAHGSLEVATAIKLAKELEPYNIAWFEEPVSPDDHLGQAEVRRATTIPIASLTSSRGVRLAPHAWGSAVRCAASIHVAVAAPNCHILEVTQGYMPMMWELFNEPFDIRPDGTVHAPERPGLGFTLRADALERFKYVTALSISSSQPHYVDGPRRCRMSMWPVASDIRT